MKEYLLNVVGIVLFASVLLSILPSGKTNELIKSIARMACLISILSPVVQFFVGNKNLPSIFGESGIELQSRYIEYCSEERISETEKLLKNDLRQRFPAVSDVEIAWEFASIEKLGSTSEEILIKEVKVGTLKSITEEEEQKIVSHLKNNYGCYGTVNRSENDG